jgi:hypothetical protein
MYTETNLLLCAASQTSAPLQDLDRYARRRGVLTEMSLRDENVLFEHSRRLGGQKQPAVATVH